MAPKSKASSKAAPIPESKAEPPPETVGERSTQRFYKTNTLQKRCEEAGLSALTPAEKKTYSHAQLIIPVSQDRVPLSTKAEREYWKQVSKENLPIRRLRRNYDWGQDRQGRQLDTYKLAEFEERSLKQARLAALDIVHRRFLAKRDKARKEGSELPAEDVEEERKTRAAMAVLRKELYGKITGPLAQDPKWDDVVPIPQAEPEDALARIAYPDDYAEAVSYLRAVMATEELSERCLRLTQLVINMNPAHYTVWLYRFRIVKALELPILDEIEWLNRVALQNLKNYQIWHHRQLLLDYYLPSISSDPVSVKKLAKSETDFISRILEEDTKNYHVWSYRQYLVGKLELWTPAELGAAQNMIEDDVRNNSAWSHRFFVVFSNPKEATPGSLPTATDPKVSAATIDRELAYAKVKIALAPQNQSSWNYLRGVLVKSGRDFATLDEFTEQFVSGLGEESEDVKSSHALDLLAEIYKAKGDKEKAKLCLERLAAKWDPVREGYWKYQIAELEK